MKTLINTELVIVTGDEFGNKDPSSKHLLTSPEQNICVGYCPEYKKENKKVKK